MHTLMACLHQTEPEHRVLAASLLLQLDIMVHTVSSVLDTSRMNKHLRSKLLKNHKGTSKKTPQNVSIVPNSSIFFMVSLIMQKYNIAASN